MTEEPKGKDNNKQNPFQHEVDLKAKRKLKARRNPNPGIWLGLGKIGLIGWTVVVPTLLGAALGIWIDSHHHGVHSWTLMLMLIGLIIGCINAWHWIAKEDREMHEDKEDKHE